MTVQRSALLKSTRFLSRHGLLQRKDSEELQSLAYTLHSMKSINKNTKFVIFLRKLSVRM